MSQPTFEVIEPGIFTTIQDLGRKGYFASGIPPSGAMDRFALRMGNLLVKNPIDEAGIEMTAVGMKVRVLQEAVVALTGADFRACLNGGASSALGDHLSPRRRHAIPGQTRQGMEGIPLRRRRDRCPAGSRVQIYLYLGRIGRNPGTRF